MRGLAAMMVAVSHSFGGIKLLSSEDNWIHELIYSIGNGALAVTLFFVLSGHVLSLSLSSKNILPLSYWPAFMIRRLFRIYPAMLICLIFCFIYLNFFHRVDIFPAASVGYYEIWQKGSSFIQLIKNIFLLDNYINPVTWTLQVEMIGAIGLPIFLTVKTRFPRIFFALLLCWISYFVLQPLYIYCRSGFIFMFLLGMYAQELSTFLANRFSNNVLYLMSLFCALLACNVHFLIKDTNAWGWLLMSFLSTLLISSTLAISSEFSHFPLDLNFTNFLGKISYSFYLWHLPILYILGTIMFQYIDNSLLLQFPFLFQYLLFFLSSILTLLIATYSFQSIESSFKLIN